LAGPVRLPTDEWRALVVKLRADPLGRMEHEASLDLRFPVADAIVYIQSGRWPAFGEWSADAAGPMAA
jgi:hypothetical protein